MLVELPNGLLDGSDLFDMVEVDELRGKQQNYLADRELVVGNIGHVPKILEDMVLSIQTKQGVPWKGKISEAIWKLPSSDIETILIKIRENTYGPKFYIEAECTHCGHKNKDLRLDLDQLKMDKLPTEELGKSKTTVLPKSGQEVEFKPIYLKDLFEVIKISTKKQNSLVTSLAAVSLKRLGEKSPVTSEDVESMSARDLMHVSKTLENLTLEGKLDTDVIIDCAECSKEFTVKLNCLDPGFFDPSKGSTT